MVIEEGITTIGTFALFDLDNMDFLKLPQSLTSIGKFGVKSLSMMSVDIPANVTSIGENAFALCAVLQKFTVAENNPAYVSVDGVLYTKDGRTLVAYPGDREGTSYSIPEGVSHIAGGAFFVNLELESISLPSTLTSMGTFAFNYCFALQKITVAEGNSAYTAVGGVLYTGDMSTLLKVPTYCGKKDFKVPDGVTAIGDFAFSDCEDISSVEIPAGVRTIGEGAFTNCINLRSVKLPAGLESIGKSAFSECSALTKVTFAGTKAQWSSVRIAEENEPLRNAPIDYTG